MQLCCVSIINFKEQKRVLLQNMYKVLRERATMEWERDALIPLSFINTFVIFSTFEEKTKTKTMSNTKTSHLYEKFYMGTEVQQLIMLYHEFGDGGVQRISSLKMGSLILITNGPFPNSQIMSYQLALRLCLQVSHFEIVD